MPIIWTVHIFIIAFLSWQISKSTRESTTKPYFWLGLISKLAAGLLLGLIYKYHYHGGDTWGFFESARVLSGMAPSDPTGYAKAVLLGEIPEQLTTEVGYHGQDRSLLMIRVVSLVLLITGGSYWLGSMYFSLFSFCGLWVLARQVMDNYPGTTKASLLAFIFFPSILFWSSGITKEAIFMGGLGFILAWFWPNFKPKPGTRLFHWLAALIIFLVLVQLKYYYMAVLLPILIATTLHRSFGFNLQGIAINSISWLIIFSMLIFLASWLHPNLRLSYVAEVMQNNAYTIISKSSDTGLISSIEHSSAVRWAAMNFPSAVFTGLFRPNLGDWGSAFQNVAVVECLMLAVLTIGRIRSLTKEQFRNTEWLPAMVYVIVLAGMMTLSTPNFGTLVRYKVAFIPIFVFIILYKNIWWNWISSRIP